MNFEDIKGDDISDETETRNGLLLAVYYKQPLENVPIILQPDLHYSQKGLEFGEAVLKLDYLVAITPVAYYFDVSDKINPFLKTGPHIWLNIRAKQEVNGNEMDVDDLIDVDAEVIIRSGL